ncbi:MAG: hypothetical protein BJ554DRAFT_8105 [Olpidium bornovanus]|uniref:Uncharacterized protein n=1 Tax=Olpidium bornovanus TaxID=278681 RepID=A0A8H7ZV39_9FUNG|nr:MAG: hypothetical protein BJ554DRAFT_8105 [Olpidium bornovanus]
MSTAPSAAPPAASTPAPALTPPFAEVELLQAKLRIAELENEKLELELKVAKRVAVSDDDDDAKALFTGNLEKTNTTVVERLVLSDSESEDEGDRTVGDTLPEALAFGLLAALQHQARALAYFQPSLETLQASIPSSSAMLEGNNMPGDLFGRGAAHLCAAVLLQTANVGDLVDNYRRQAIKSLSVEPIRWPSPRSFVNYGLTETESEWTGIDEEDNEPRPAKAQGAARVDAIRVPEPEGPSPDVTSRTRPDSLEALINSGSETTVANAPFANWLVECPVTANRPTRRRADSTQNSKSVLFARRPSLPSKQKK